MNIEKYSIGIGDRFAHQGDAQLRAVAEAQQLGVSITPVWNKSNREHNLIKSEPADVRREADASVSALNWKGPYRVDADHINLETLNRFLEACDFYTIDVADYIGTCASREELEQFKVDCHRQFGARELRLSNNVLQLTPELIDRTSHQFLGAVREASRIYHKIAFMRGEEFIAEVSMDEADVPQSPVELLLILFMLTRDKVPCQTIAPKFTGRFNKGVDYVGEPKQFGREFSEYLDVIQFSIREFGMPVNLKLSIHSGSDKFSLYPVINRLMRQYDAGVHIKTAGTTWLEEVIGLAESGGDGLQMAKDIYIKALDRFDELVSPYAPVVDIARNRLPSGDDVRDWTSAGFCSALRHNQNDPGYNPHFRQLLHVAFKIAAEMEGRYTEALQANKEIIARNVTENLYDRHIYPLFLQSN